MLTNFGIPFFVNVMKLNDCNEWGEFGEELNEWLKKEAQTREGEPLAVSSCNKVINSLNHFMKWLKRKKHIEYKNYRQFEAFDQRKTTRRGHEDLVTPEVFKAVHSYLKRHHPLYADLWLTQRAQGFRINEILGLPFDSLSDECPKEIKEEFESKGFKVFGSILLESQPAKPYIKRINGVIPRAPLKWRDDIGPDFSRTIPIVDKEVWDILVNRYDVQMELWEKQAFGLIKDSYLLFDGGQRTKYLDAVREAYGKLGLESDGTHVLRHTLATEWTFMKIDPKICEVVLGHKEKAHGDYVHMVGKINADRMKLAPMKRLKKVG